MRGHALKAHTSIWVSVCVRVHAVQKRGVAGIRNVYTQNALVSDLSRLPDQPSVGEIRSEIKEKRFFLGGSGGNPGTTIVVGANNAEKHEAVFLRTKNRNYLQSSQDAQYLSALVEVHLQVMTFLGTLLYTSHKRQLNKACETSKKRGNG